MDKRKLVFLHNIPEAMVRDIEETVPGWQVTATGDKSVTTPLLGQAEIVVGWNGRAEACLAPDTPLRWIHVWGAGVDWLPLDRIAAREVLLTNSSGIHAIPIAESVMGMMLMLARKLHQHVRNQQSRVWKPVDGTGEIHGKTLCIMGAGRIGAELARLAKAFGMQVLAIRRSDGDAAGADRTGRMDMLEVFLGESDYVVNILPATEETRHLMNAVWFSRMKPTAAYLSVGRGMTTETQALLEALETGVIAGAALDVTDPEPLPADHPLWGMENVILTPHVSGLTDRYDERAMALFLPLLAEYAAGGLPSRNRVDLTSGY